MFNRRSLLLSLLFVSQLLIGSSVHAVTLGGTITNLIATSIDVSLNGQEETFNTSGEYQFSQILETGQEYEAIITRQPSHYACFVSNGKGIVGTSNISNININCETRSLDMQVIDPVEHKEKSIVATVVSVNDRDTQRPVTGLNIYPNFTLNDFLGKENDQILNEESFLDTEPLDKIPATIQTVLMLDHSSSIDLLELETIKNAAKSLVQDSQGNSKLADNQTVAVYVFDDTIKPVIGFSNNAQAIVDAINGITRGNSSTNLYGAVIEGLALWNNNFDLDQINKGALFLLTDGIDTTSSYTYAETVEARLTSGKDVYALAVGGNTNIYQLQTITGYTSRVYPISNFDEQLIANAFADAQENADNFHIGKYLIRYASAKRSGDHTFEVSINNNEACPVDNADCDVVSGDFNADTFTAVTPEIVVYANNVSGNNILIESGETEQIKVKTRWSNDPADYEWVYDNAQTGYQFGFNSSQSEATVQADNVLKLPVTIYDCNYRAGYYADCNTSTVSKLIYLQQPNGISVSGVVDGVYALTAANASLDLRTVLNGVANTRTYSVTVSDETNLNASISGSTLNLSALQNGLVEVTVTDDLDYQYKFVVNIALPDNDADNIPDAVDNDDDNDGVDDSADYAPFDPGVSLAPAPANFTLTNNGDYTLTLNWDAVAGTSQYTLYWSTTSFTAAEVNTANAVVRSGTSYAFSADPSETYYFRVAVTSPFQGVVSNIKSGNSAQSAPDLTAIPTASGYNIDLDWTAVSGATQYTVFWDTTPFTGTSAANSITTSSTSYTLSNADPQNTYYFRVAVTSPYFDTLSAQVQANTAKAAPTLTATAIDESIQLDWTTVSGVSQYTLFWDTVPFTGISAANSITTTSASYNLSGAEPTKTYYFRVAATVPYLDTLSELSVAFIDNHPSQLIIRNMIATGYDTTCVIDDNNLKCWGKNISGETNVPSLSNPLIVSANANNHTCALDDDGVACWGSNAYGQTDVPILSNPTIVTTGYSHTCALDDSGVVCWGRNDFGQTTVPALSNPTAVFAGGSNTCAFDDDGLKCWGNGSSGQLNIPSLSNPKNVSIGWSHICALDDNGLSCWGHNGNGRIDVPSLSNPTMVSVGGNHTCAIDDDGATCWGWNDDGQTNVPPLSNPIAISSGVRHTCALADNGMNCWGNNDYYQSKMPVFTDIELGGYSCGFSDQGFICWDYGSTPWVNPISVSVGYRHICGIDDNVVSCVGLNGHGQTNVPILSNPSMVSAGGFHTCALDDAGVKCWGYNAYGQVVVPSLVNPTMVSAGLYHTCALGDNGVTCWGWNDDGQTNVPPLSNPTMVTAGGQHSCALDDNGFKCWGRFANVTFSDTTTDIALGTEHVCALDANGVSCWGNNAYGQIDVPVLNHPIAVSAGDFHTCALEESGSVTCWGRNDHGQTSSPSISLSFLNILDFDNDGIVNQYDSDRDGDQMLDSWEEANYVNSYNPDDGSHDPDFDGLTNYQEFLASSNPYVASDTDSDGVPDYIDNCLSQSNADQLDYDNDGVGDVCDSDDDDDGLPDSWEDTYGLDSKDASDASLDSDIDSLSALQEYQLGTNPNKKDTDNDGVNDNVDLWPTDSSESTDLDGDGIGDNSDPDIDGDGMPNTYETSKGFDPNDAADGSSDFDNDGFSNAEEYEAGTDPKNADDAPRRSSVILKILPLILNQ